jgi:hypothetical protein
MLNESLKVAYNRGRYEMAMEMLDKCSIADTISVARFRAMLHEMENCDPNDGELDTLSDVPDYVIARCHAVSGPLSRMPTSAELHRPLTSPLRAVPNGD